MTEQFCSWCVVPCSVAQHFNEEITMAGVIYDHVTKSFGDVKAVNDMNLDIPDKEFPLASKRLRLGPSRLVIAS
jgi:hypothetical protein